MLTEVWDLTHGNHTSVTDLLGSGLKKYREPEWVDEVQLKQEIEKIQMHRVSTA